MFECIENCTRFSRNHSPFTINSIHQPTFLRFSELFFRSSKASKFSRLVNSAWRAFQSLRILFRELYKHTNLTLSALIAFTGYITVLNKCYVLCNSHSKVQLVFIYPIIGNRYRNFFPQIELLACTMSTKSATGYRFVIICARSRHSGLIKWSQ